MGIMFDILLPLLLFFVRDLGTLSWRIFEMRRHFTFEGGMLQVARQKSFSVTHVRAATLVPCWILLISQAFAPIPLGPVVARQSITHLGHSLIIGGACDPIYPCWLNRGCLRKQF